MAKQHSQKPLAAAIGAAFLTTVSASTLVQANENPFSATKLNNGYMQMAAAEEGKCGGNKAMPEGKCGGEKLKNMKEGKCGEGKCGANKAKAMKEGKCGGNKAMEEGKCGTNKAMPEGKCGGEKAKTMPEGKCGGTK